MEYSDLQRALEAILFASGDPMPAQRMAAVLECDVDQIHEAMQSLMDSYAFDRRGIRILRLEDSYQMCSAGEWSACVTRALETRKPPKLSASQLETLTVIAYYQPATKAYVEQIPLKRFGTADEVANMVSALVSDQFAYVTGQVFVLDGGLSL